MQNDFCHIELNTTDLEGAKKFYFELFSWDKEETPMPSGELYTVIKPGKGPMGGMMKSPEPSAPPTWLVYITIDDVEAVSKKAAELGGKILLGKTPVPEIGHFSVIQDPQGAVFALWEPTEKG